MGDGRIAVQAVSYDDIAPGMERIEAARGRAGRDFAEVGVRVTLTRMSGEGSWAKDAVIEYAVAAERRLSGLGVTYYTIPLDLYRLEMDDRSVGRRPGGRRESTIYVNVDVDRLDSAV
jgi:hypothetical protein